MAIKEWIDKWIVFTGAITVVLVAGGTFLLGGPWVVIVSNNVFTVLMGGLYIAGLLCFLGLPLYLGRRTRKIIGLLIYFSASYSILAYWIRCFIIVYVTYGQGAALGSSGFLGVGTILLSYFACLTSGKIATLAELLSMAAAMWGFWKIGAITIEKSEELIHLQDAQKGIPQQ